MKRLLIADTGPLIIFARSGRLSLLRDTAKQILVTTTVRQECLARSDKPGATIILKAFEEGSLSLVDDVDIGAALGKTPLDAGEKAAIALALSRNDPASSLLIDEILGRGVARQYGLSVIGSAGILLVAKRRGLIDKLEPILGEWQQMGYWLKESLVTQILTAAGERTSISPKQSA